MTTSRPHLLIRQDAILCALPLQRVREVMRPLSLEPLRGAAPFVIGLSRIRGQPVAVLELAAMLGQPGAQPAARWVALSDGQRLTALAVQEVIGVSRLGEGREAVPPLLGAEVLEGIGRIDRELVLVLGEIRAVPTDAAEARAR